MSLTNFRSILIFASCVVGTHNILYEWVYYCSSTSTTGCGSISARKCERSVRPYIMMAEWPAGNILIIVQKTLQEEKNVHQRKSLKCQNTQIYGAASRIDQMVIVVLKALLGLRGKQPAASIKEQQLCSKLSWLRGSRKSYIARPPTAWLSRLLDP